MEGFVSFLTSETGQIFCYVLLVVGVVDMIMSKLIFSKKMKSIEEQKMQTGSEVEKENLDKKLKQLKIISMNLQFTGIAFIAIALFGLTR